MAENKEGGKSIGFRGIHIEEFLEQFARLGYTLPENEKLNVSTNDIFWDDVNQLVPKTFKVVLNPETREVHIVPATPSKEDYEKITDQLQKGQEEHAELQRVKEKNAELEHAEGKIAELEQKLEQAESQLHGTKTGITGLQSQKDAEAAELAELKAQKLAVSEEIEKSEAEKQGLESSVVAVRAELDSLREQYAVLQRDKEEAEHFLNDKDPTVKTIKEDIAELDRKKQESQKQCKEAEEALELAKAKSKEECAELTADFNQREKKLHDLTVTLENAEAEFEKVSSELEAKKAAVGAVKTDPEAIQKSKTYKQLSQKYKKLDLVLRQVIRSVVPLDSNQIVDNAVIGKFLGKLSEIDTLYAKLDEVAAGVLEQEPESAEPKAEDSTIAKLWDGVKSAKDSAVTAIFRKKPKEQSDEKHTEVSRYLVVLDKIKAEFEAYKVQIAGYKSLAEEARAAPAGLDEKAERLLNELSDAVADVPSADEIADSAFMGQYVSEVRRCAFELYSIAASRDPEVMYFVLSELAGLSYDDGKKAEAESFAARARSFCKDKLPDKLVEAEENLAFYRAELKG